jgi:2-iminobutanoate/2-iminopropanoate deaminase
MDSKVKHYPEYWGGKKLAYPHVSAEAPKFSRSVVVGNLIFVSGCQGMNPETVKTETAVFEEQMLIALDKVRMAMEEAGSSMNNIVKTLILLKNSEDYPRMRRTELEYYRNMPHSWSITHRPVLLCKPPVWLDLNSW